MGLDGDTPEQKVDLAAIVDDLNAFEETLDGTAASLAGVVWLCGEVERVVQSAADGQNPEAGPRLRQMSALLAANARALLRPGETERAFRHLVQHTISGAQALADKLEDSDPDEEQSSA